MSAAGPAWRDFAAAYEAGAPQVVWRKLAADTLTPVAAMLRLGENGGGRFLLESVEGGAHRGRYSAIGMEPDLIWRCRRGRAEVNRNACEGGDFTAETAPPLQSLRALTRACRIPGVPALPPMACGLFGYMGYDAVRMMERLPPAPEDPLALWESVYVRPTVVVVFDSVQGAMYLLTPVWPEGREGASRARRKACERLDRVALRLARPHLQERVLADIPHDSRDPHDPRDAGNGTQEESAHGDAPSQLRSNMTRPAFEAMVEKARAYIHAGDILQVVLSQRFSCPFTLPPFALYRALRRLNPSPFLFYFNYDDFVIVGSSPEILVRLRRGTITLRPIAGTRRRGANAEEDRRLAQELLSDPKEKAEHLMLLDLGRNDVGRVAQTGTVNVTERMKVEYYSHVMHMVSNVNGTFQQDKEPLDALIAGFPAGTVSGAPKLRAMEIIDELEPEARGVYAGAIGYFSGDGDLDTCIALRTALIKNGVLHVQAGGGIVADSSPAAEYEESVNKARAILRAAADARLFATSAQS